MGKLGAVVTLGGCLRILQLGHVGLTDSLGAIFVTALAEPSPPLGENQTLMIATLDLCHNELGAGFASALPAALRCLPKLSSCNLSHNNFGAEAGANVITSLLPHPSLRFLDLSATNLCECSVARHT